MTAGIVERYTQTENKTGRWVNRGTVERVYWRAIPFDPAQPITYHRTKRAALAALGSADSGEAGA